MEDPATWGPVEHVVADALDQAREANKGGVYGLSEVRHVTDALRAAGLLKDGVEKGTT